GHGAQAYSDLKNGHYTAILEYPGAAEVLDNVFKPPALARPRVANEVRVGCIGAGSFASSVIFPNLRSIQNARLHAVASASGIGAVSAQRAFKFRKVERPSELLANPDIDLAFILTQHSTHATCAARALQLGKSVFVEKPLAIDLEELTQLKSVFE